MGQTGEHAPQSPDFKVDPDSIGGRAIAWFRRYRANKIAERLAERQARPPLGIAMPGKSWDKLTPEEREAQWTRFDRAGETVLGMTGQLATRALEYPGVATLRNAISKNLRERYGVRRADSLAQQIVSDRVYRPMERRIMGVRGETLPSVMQNLESGIWPGMKVAVLPEYTVSRAGSGYFTGGKGNPDYPGVRILMRREAVIPDPKTRTIADPVDVGSETTRSLFDPGTVKTRRAHENYLRRKFEVEDTDMDVPSPFVPTDTTLRNAVRHADHMDYFYVPVKDSFRAARAAQWPYILEKQDAIRFGPKTVNALRHQTRKRLEDRYREMLWEGADVVREYTRNGAMVWDPKLRMTYPRGYPASDIDRYQHNFFSLPYADSPGGKYPDVLRDMILKGSRTRDDYFYADSRGSSAFPIVHPGTSIRNMLQDTYGETQILREIRDTEAAKAFLFDSRLKSMDPKTLDRAQSILRERGIPYDVYNNAAEEAVLSTEMGAPFRQDAKGGDTRVAAKAGDSPDRFSMSRNFLATDKVPDAIFGIPVVSNEDDYTPEDLAFFREHPEAGGYYDMGEGTPEDGSAEGAPTQADEAGDADNPPFVYAEDGSGIVHHDDGGDDSVLQGHDVKEVAGKFFKALTLANLDPTKQVGDFSQSDGQVKTDAQNAVLNLANKYWKGMSTNSRKAFTDELQKLAGATGVDETRYGITSTEPGQKRGNVSGIRTYDLTHGYTSYDPTKQLSLPEAITSYLNTGDIPNNRVFVQSGMAGVLGGKLPRGVRAGVEGQVGRESVTLFNRGAGPDAFTAKEARAGTGMTGSAIGTVHGIRPVGYDHEGGYWFAPGIMLDTEGMSQLFEKTGRKGNWSGVEKKDGSWYGMSHVDFKDAPHGVWFDKGAQLDAKGGRTTRAGLDAGTPKRAGSETFDTPIPAELQARYNAWYAQLPKNLQYTGDYDLQGAWLEKLGQPDKYEATQNGHLDDYGKKPNHITFSTGSKWHDPKVPERTGGEWRQAKDGSWDFYPGTGNKASDDELKAYFEKYEKGNRVHRRGAPPATRGKYPGSLNNPGNVEKRPVRRKGEVLSPHDRWAKFATPQDGLREMADAIRQIADVKLAEKDRPFTIRNFAEVYAPRFNEKGEPENDTDRYIRDISSTSGIDADAVLDRWNTDDMAKLLKTVVRFESGAPHSRWFTDDEYRTAARELEEGAID